MGEPQRLCREITHSRRFSTIPAIRASPHGGTHATRRMASRAPLLRSAVGSSNRMNHWTVARKITGFLQRQQCGYSWRNAGSKWTRAPAASRSATISGFASRTLRPLYFATVVNRPPSSTGERMGRFSRTPV